MVKSVFGLVVALLLIAGGQVLASEYYKKVVYSETVYVKQTKTVPYQVEVVKYDHCGKPYFCHRNTLQKYHNDGAQSRREGQVRQSL